MEQIVNLPEAPRTLRSLFGKKILDAFEELSLSRTMRSVAMLGAAGALTAVFVLPDLFVGAAGIVWGAYNGVLPKFLLSLGFVFYSKPACRFMRRNMRQKPNSTLIEGIPVMELLDHIFTFGSFKRDAILKKFGLSVARFNKLARRLDDLEIFDRDENNARILNPEVSRQDIAAILAGKQEAQELTATLRQVGENHMTAEPTAAMIKGRVKESLITPPVFAMRKLS